MMPEVILSREQVRRVDKWATQQYGLAGIVMMENAGGGAARIIDGRYGPGAAAFIACGVGNNGGDGLVIARHLHNAGWTVRVLVAGSVEAMTADCAANDRIVRAMGLERIEAGDPEAMSSACGLVRPDEIVIDALLGTGFRGEVREPLAGLISALNAAPKRAMVAIDLPSGLDCDTGQPGGVAIRADLTVTFVARKPGFLKPGAAVHVGACEIVDIGAPRELVRSVAK